MRTAAYGTTDPGTPVTDAAACFRTSSLRPVMYTLAPFAAKAFAIINPLPDSQSRVAIENQGTYIPVPPPVTRPTRPESDITVAMLRSAMIKNCWIACRHSPFYSIASGYCVNDINPESYSAGLYPGVYGKWRLYVKKTAHIPISIVTKVLVLRTVFLFIGSQRRLVPRKQVS